MGSRPVAPDTSVLPDNQHCAQSAGQGLRIEGRSGSSSVFQQDPKLRPKYQSQLPPSQKLASNWRSQSKKGKLDCTSSGVLCGRDAESTQAATTLRIATSPAVYDTRNASHTGGWVLAPTSSDQGDCNSCVGWALAAAAQSAAAAALRVNSNKVPLISVLQVGTVCNTAPEIQADICVLSQV